jgi:hypothetical protein
MVHIATGPISTAIITAGVGIVSVTDRSVCKYALVQLFSVFLNRIQLLLKKFSDILVAFRFGEFNWRSTFIILRSWIGSKRKQQFNDV